MISRIPPVVLYVRLLACVGLAPRLPSTLHCLRLTISTYVAALSIFLRGRLR